MKIFESARIGSVVLKNRLIRSATYEGMADTLGFPQPKYKALYTQLARNDIGGIITGFTYVSKAGRAMQKQQAGVDSSEKAAFYREVTEGVHKYGSKVFIQLVHAGRQARQQETGQSVWGVSDKKSRYFGEVPQRLTTEQVFGIIEQFTNAAVLAKEAGFDGVQIHAAHGYLVHQFLLPSINDRTDLFKPEPDTKIGTRFLELVIDKVRERCGGDFPILIKISGSDDGPHFLNLIRFLDRKKVDAIEISYGTMDNPFDIFRGDIPVDLILAQNPICGTNNKLKRWLKKVSFFPVLRLKTMPFKPMYNLKYAKIARQNTSLPIICVGGIRRGKELKHIVENEKIDFVSLCRPFICEPDFVQKLFLDADYVSQCINCNCVVQLCVTQVNLHVVISREKNNEHRKTGY